MEPPERGVNRDWRQNPFDPVFRLRKEGRDARSAKGGKVTFCPRSISMRGKQFEVMEEIGEKIL